MKLVRKIRNLPAWAKLGDFHIEENEQNNTYTGNGEIYIDGKRYPHSDGKRGFIDRKVKQLAGIPIPDTEYVIRSAEIRASKLPYNDRYVECSIAKTGSDVEIAKMTVKANRIAPYLRKSIVNVTGSDLKAVEGALEVALK